MKALFILPILCLLVYSCTNAIVQNRVDVESKTSKETIYLFCEGIIDKGDPVGYKNKVGEIIVPAGKYQMIISDSIVDIGFVLSHKGAWLALNSSGEELFEVFNYDNGPDYVEEGLFRILKDEKIGFANEKGEIVIPCKYSCAYPFEGGKANVSDDCEKISENEHVSWKSESWFYINKKGEKLTP
jgi:hypothetical protein